MADSQQAATNFLVWQEKLCNMDSETRLWAILYRYERGVDIQTCVRLTGQPRKELEQRLQRFERNGLAEIYRFVLSREKAQELQRQGKRAKVAAIPKKLWVLTDDGRRAVEAAQSI